MNTLDTSFQPFSKTLLPKKNPETLTEHHIRKAVNQTRQHIQLACALLVQRFLDLSVIAVCFTTLLGKVAF